MKTFSLSLSPPTASFFPTLKPVLPHTLSRAIQSTPPNKFTLEMGTGQELRSGTRVGRFIVRDLVGQGGFGQIYRVEDSQTGRISAMKIEYYSAAKQGIEEEIAIFKQLGNCPLFPLFIADSDTEDFRFLVMELLGPSIGSVRRALKSQKFAPYTLLHIAYHSIRAIEAFHEKGFIHRDVKPGNFLIRPDRRNPVVLIDFGLSKTYRSPNGQHLMPREFPGYTGTVRYASLHAHDKMELSRRDDLISWFYSMIECATGDTPWPGHDDKTKAIAMKRAIKPRQLCAGLPFEFREIWSMISALEYEDRPGYEDIKALIVQALRHAAPRKHRYDWERMKRSAVAELTSLELDMGEPLWSDTLAGDPEEGEGGCRCNLA
jgi:serine/threonine protein kinase